MFSTIIKAIAIGFSTNWYLVDSFQLTFGLLGQNEDEKGKILV